MTRTRRMIGVSAFATLAVLSAGWALEKGFSSYAHGLVAVGNPAKPSDEATAPRSRESRDERGSEQEYDRSDLLLSQG